MSAGAQSGGGAAAGAQVRLDAIAREIRDHLPCEQEPCRTCEHFVPGAGNPQAEIVIVGEAPGASEDRTGEPFVGAAGKLLDRLLEAARLDRAEVFITNVVKARPPGNRDPKADEVRHHWPWLEAQLEIIAPRLLVPLGRHALGRFGPDKTLKISEVHGRVLETPELTLFPLYHPSAAMHSPPLRETLFEDARALGETLRALR